MNTKPDNKEKEVIPRPNQVDENWFDHIQRAKQAREQGRKAREQHEKTIRKGRWVLQ